MIYKVLTRSTPSYNGLINYILNENKVPERQIFTHNLRSQNTDIKGLTKEFIENESYRNFNRSDQIYLNHEIISFSGLDSPKITPDILSDIMEKYASLRGPNGVYIGAIHQDKEHIHLHIAVSGLAYRTGKSFYLPKDKLNDLKKELQEYQKEKYPELKHSLPKHGGRKEYLTDREWQANKKEGRNSIKEKITPIIQKALEKSGTQKEFLELLSKQNLHYYERNGIPTGLIVDETKIRFTRLGISKEQLNKLPMDINAEKIALNQIQQIRLERDFKSQQVEKPQENLNSSKNKFDDKKIDVEGNIIKQNRLDVIRERMANIEAICEDTLLSSELSLSLQMQMENLQIEERELTRQIEGLTDDIEVVPYEDGLKGDTKVIHIIENGIEKTISFNEYHIEKSWSDTNGIIYSNESYLEPEIREGLDMMYETMDNYDNGLIKVEVSKEDTLDEFDLADNSETSENHQDKKNEISDSQNVDVTLNEINEIRDEMNEIDDPNVDEEIDR